MLDDKSPMLANIGNDHEFIGKECSLHWYEKEFLILVYKLQNGL